MHLISFSFRGIFEKICLLLSCFLFGSLADYSYRYMCSTTGQQTSWDIFLVSIYSTASVNSEISHFMNDESHQRIQIFMNSLSAKTIKGPTHLGSNVTKIGTRQSCPNTRKKTLFYVMAHGKIYSESYQGVFTDFRRNHIILQRTRFESTIVRAIRVIVAGNVHRKTD